MGKIIIDITDSDYQSHSTYKLSTSASFSSCSLSASYLYVIKFEINHQQQLFFSLDSHHGIFPFLH